jgi:hypothetical protein
MPGVSTYPASVTAEAIGSTWFRRLDGCAQRGADRVSLANAESSTASVTLHETTCREPASDRGRRDELQAGHAELEPIGSQREGTTLNRADRRRS